MCIGSVPDTIIKDKLPLKCKMKRNENKKDELSNPIVYIIEKRPLRIFTVRHRRIQE